MGLPCALRCRLQAWPGDREGGACFWMGLMCTCGHRLWAGPEEVSVWRRGEGQTGAHYWTGDSLRISPPTSCLTRRQKTKGALLNGNSVRLSQPTSHLARRRKKGALLDWVFSASLAADFAPDPEADAEGRITGRRLCAPFEALCAFRGSVRLLPAASDLDLRQRQ